MLNRRHVFRSLLALPAALVGARLGHSRTAAPVIPQASEEDESFWHHLRWQFFIPEDQAFFNTGTLGASPKVVVDAVVRHLRYVEESLALWDYSAEKPERLAGYRPEETLRGKIAGLIGCGMKEVGLTVNATVGMNLVANGLDLERGDEVLITNREHGGGRSGWDVKAKRFGVVVKEVAVDAASHPDEIVRAFEQAVGPRTRVLAFPHMTSGQGVILPARRLAALARDRGILSVIDGAQALGQIPVDLREIGCDAYFSSPHKWLLAPKGTGFLYVRDGVQDRIWTTLASYQWDNHKDGMFRLMQIGTHNLSLLQGFEAAIDFVNQIGLARIHQRIRFLGSYLRKGLTEIPGVVVNTPLHPEMAAGITNYGVEGLTGRQIQDELWNRKRIRVRAASETAVRQSCHIYNTRRELDDTLEIVKDLTRPRA